jgi:N6-adenosine-specific RNA methylase IME4
MKKYKTILADPPWQCNSKGWEKSGWGKIKSHYPLMHHDEIKALPVPELAADDCILLMWTTWTHIPKAIEIGEQWGFEYKNGFPWIKTTAKPYIGLYGEIEAKPTYGLGYWVRGCSEPLLIFSRGKAKPNNNFVGLISERLEHSRKPKDVYDFAMSFEPPYLELFARNRHDGWDVWGNEVESDVELKSNVQK